MKRMRGNMLEPMRGKNLLRMFAVVFQKIPARTAADHGKPFRAEAVLERAEAVVIADNQARLANPIKSSLTRGDFFDPAIQGLGIGGVADKSPNFIPFLRQPHAQAGPGKVFCHK